MTAGRLREVLASLEHVHVETLEGSRLGFSPLSESATISRRYAAKLIPGAWMFKKRARSGTARAWMAPGGATANPLALSNTVSLSEFAISS
jgi:hypothetical protein